MSLNQVTRHSREGPFGSTTSWFTRQLAKLARALHSSVRRHKRVFVDVLSDLHAPDPKTLDAFAPGNRSPLVAKGLRTKRSTLRIIKGRPLEVILTGVASARTALLGTNLPRFRQSPTPKCTAAVRPLTKTFTPLRREPAIIPRCPNACGKSCNRMRIFALRFLCVRARQSTRAVRF